uniref:Alpha-N-acetylglucosaminidase n=3 Tax=Cacopsylla melanoneura TaxID=428564 RepID=A0A8D8ZZE1_9HEMI
MLPSYLHCFKLFFSLVILATSLDSALGHNISQRSSTFPEPKWGREVIAEMTHNNSGQRISKFHFSHVRPSSTVYEQNIAAQNLVRRVMGENTARHFNLTVDNTLTKSEKDAFHLLKKGGNIVHIVGNSVTAAVSGFHYYLKHYLNGHISWDYDQLELPDTYPDVDIYIKFPERFRLFQNVCTQSYSYVWWNWARWEREIDRWALNGFNLVYAGTGVEAVWTKVYRELGLSQREIADYFSGPAFLAWNRMGNVRGWGGPLSVAWHSGQSLLQRRILSRMRELSITPILPAFSGIVPNAFQRLYPNAQLSKLSRWCNFEDKYCCPLLLDPSDELFSKVGTKFLQEVIAQFGTNHMYSADTFNENIPQHGDVEYLANVSRSIYQAMSDVDSNAIWVLQGWMFVNQVLYWTQDKVKAFLTAVPQGKLLVLDLAAEQIPSHDRLHSFYGQPYIWCMLHNFGGTLGMHGSLPKVNAVWKPINLIR